MGKVFKPKLVCFRIGEEKLVDDVSSTEESDLEDEKEEDRHAHVESRDTLRVTTVPNTTKEKKETSPLRMTAFVTTPTQCFNCSCNSTFTASSQETASRSTSMTSEPDSHTELDPQDLVAKSLVEQVFGSKEVNDWSHFFQGLQ